MTQHRTSNSGDGSRVFNIDDGNALSAINVGISGLTLTGGDVTGSGGAILSNENLTVSDSTVIDNSATEGGGGIYSAAGSLTITRSTVSANLRRDWWRRP